jgi:hypothetical protein
MRRLAAITLAVCTLGNGPDLGPETFEALHRLIRPQAGEFAWYEEIPWLTSIQQAREKAAAEGKPILVWSSADGQPCGAT